MPRMFPFLNITNYYVFKYFNKELMDHPKTIFTVSGISIEILETEKQTLFKALNTTEMRENGWFGDHVSSCP